MTRKYLHSLVLVALLGLAAACSPRGAFGPGQDGLMLDSFEGTVDAQTADFGSSGDSRIEVGASAVIKSCGEQSLAIAYELAPGGYMYCARGYGLDVLGATWSGPAPDQIAWADFKGFSLQVHGANAGPIAFDVKDRGGELHRTIIDGNFSGWKEVVIPYGQFSAREDWQPASADGNKTLDFPLQSFQFEPKEPGAATIYVDCVKLITSRSEE